MHVYVHNVLRFKCQKICIISMITDNIICAFEDLGSSCSYALSHAFLKGFSWIKFLHSLGWDYSALL